LAVGCSQGLLESKYPRRARRSITGAVDAAGESDRRARVGKRIAARYQDRGRSPEAQTFGLLFGVHLLMADVGVQRQEIDGSTKIPLSLLPVRAAGEYCKVTFGDIASPASRAIGCLS
jgi:hypothetical protein